MNVYHVNKLMIIALNVIKMVIVLIVKLIIFWQQVHIKNIV